MFDVEPEISLDVDVPFVLETRLSGRHTQPPGVEQLPGWETLLAAAVGEPVPRQWLTATSAGLDGLRLCRRDGPRDDEEYVVVLRQIWIGRSVAGHAILLSKHSPELTPASCTPLESNNGTQAVRVRIVCGFAGRR